MSGWGVDDYEFQRMLRERLAQQKQDSSEESPEESPERVRVSLESRRSPVVARRKAKSRYDDDDSSSDEDQPRKRTMSRWHRINNLSSPGSDASSLSSTNKGRSAGRKQQQQKQVKAEKVVRNRSSSRDTSSSEEDVRQSNSQRRVNSRGRKESRSASGRLGKNESQSSGHRKMETDDESDTPYRKLAMDASKESPPLNAVEARNSSQPSAVRRKNDSDADSDYGKENNTSNSASATKCNGDNAKIPAAERAPSAASMKVDNPQSNSVAKKPAADGSDDDSWDSDSDNEALEKMRRKEAIAKGLPVHEITQACNTSDQQQSQSSGISDAPKLINSQDRNATKESKQRPADSSGSDDNSSGSEDNRVDSSRKRKFIHNPYTPVQEPKKRDFGILYAAPIAKNSQDGDLLWSDSENEQLVPARRQRTGSRGRTAVGSSNPALALAATRGPPGSPVAAIGPPALNRNSTPREKKADDSSLLLELHPTFDFPRFGPAELLPLVLEHGPQGMNHQVPAALARYLPNYQREGIQFLYNAVINGKGAILGDDMGLGKTVQMISLLAALFEKSGSAVDKKRIERRKRLVDTRELKRNLQSTDDLMTGNVKLLQEDREGRLQYSDGDPELGHSCWVPVLLAVPSSVIDNWQLEFKKFGHFRVSVFRDKDRRDLALKEIRQGYAEVLLVSHTLLVSHFESLLPISWKLGIVDEYHTMKSKKGKAAICLRMLTQTHPDCRLIGMTGTLQQNSHEELWNLVDIIYPNVLGSWKQFEKETVRPIKNSRSSKATFEQVSLGERTAVSLGGKLKDIYIERSKKDVLDKMPDKNEMVVLCEPSLLQKRLYKHFLSLPDFVLLRTAHGPCDCGINQNFFIEYKQLKSREERTEYQRKNTFQKRAACCYQRPVVHRNGPINEDAVLWRAQHPDDCACPSDKKPRCPFCIFFACLNKLYKLSSHVALLQTAPADMKKEANREKAKQFARVAFPPDVLKQLPGGSYERGDGISDAHFELSGKMRELHKLLQKIVRENGRVLVFSYSTQTLDLIQNYLKSDGVRYSRIDGGTPSHKRQQIVDNFQNDPSIFCMLLSTKAAGIGLNLTAANNVIIFDVEWNPSNDEQAQDRAFRIGQKRDVNVYRLVSIGTIDELKYLRQIYKVQLKKETLRKDSADVGTNIPRIFRAVQGDNSRKGELFGSENLLKWKDGSFMTEISKAANKEIGGFNSGEVFSIGTLANTAQKLSEEQLAHVIEADEAELDLSKWLGRENKQQAHTVDGEHEAAKDVPSGSSPQNDEDVVHNQQIDHSTFFSGKAKNDRADDDEDESSVEDVMGGETQMVEELCDDYKLPPAEAGTEAMIVIEEDGQDDDSDEESLPMVVDSEIRAVEDSKAELCADIDNPVAPTPAWSRDEHVKTPSSTVSYECQDQLIELSHPPKKRISKHNFQLVGVPMDQVRCKRATFSKFDILLPKPSKTESED